MKLTLRDIEGVETLSYSAGSSNDATSAIDFRLTRLISYEETFDSAKRAPSAGVSKFLFLSSCSVYVRSPSVRISESSQIIPLTFYSKSKLNTEKKLITWESTDSIAYILRQPTVFGMSQNFRVDLVLNGLIVRSVIENKLRLYSRGLEVWSFVSLNNLCAVVGFFAG